MSVLRGERKGIEKRFEELCLQVVKECGLELYDFDYLSGSSTLRVFIRDPKTDSAVLEDCVKVDKAMTPFIEELDWMPEALTLEVSSPGLYRNLNKVEHFSAAVGGQIAVTLTGKNSKEVLPEKLKGQKKLVGTLVKADDDGLEMSVDEQTVNLTYEDIKKANLETDVSNI